MYYFASLRRPLIDGKLTLDQDQRNYQELSQREYKVIFDQYYVSIRSFIYYKCSNMKMAEDIAQDTFVKLWENRHKIDVKTVKSYLYTIAGNLTINQLKREQLKYKFQSQIDKQQNDLDPSFLMQMKEYEAKLNEVLSIIPDGAREVFLMNRIEGLKYKEISERLGIGVKAVEKRMSKALKIIREKLGVNL